jgi:hypothetical protein
MNSKEEGFSKEYFHLIIFFIISSFSKKKDKLIISLMQEFLQKREI